jgi:hypothetical protein
MSGLPKNYHLYKSFLISETMCVYILFILEHYVFFSLTKMTENKKRTT